MPTAPPGVGHLRGDRPFPEAAREALGRRPAAAQPRPRHRRPSAPSAPRAVAELPDWPQLRAAGAAIKDDVLAHLDRYLVQLEEQVTARGGVVHWARDADEANRIVTDLVRATGADEVVKVKSMATQEIGLNEALAAAGIAAWETDLAELIVQLGDDQPSHILVPGDPPQPHARSATSSCARWRAGPAGPGGLTDDPAALAEAARLHLRREVPARRGRRLRRQLRGRRDRHAGRRRVRGQRPDVPDPAARP